MEGKSGAIRAGRAFVELFADGSKLVRGLKSAAGKLKAFGSQVRNLGLGLMAAGSAVSPPRVSSESTPGSGCICRNWSPASDSRQSSPPRRR
jgi:hypothetical protein